MNIQIHSEEKENASERKLNFYWMHFYISLDAICVRSRIYTISHILTGL